MLYALVLTMHLLNGSIQQTIPETYHSMNDCIAEVAHQRAQGIPKDVYHCEPLED